MDCVDSFCFVFFFSSRRRHTRLVSDWSSDVCSSDLCGCLDWWQQSGTVWASSTWEHARELWWGEQWTGADPRYECGLADRCGARDLQGEWQQHQFLGDAGVARQPVGHDLLAAVVQLCRPRYPVAYWERQRF